MDKTNIKKTARKPAESTSFTVLKEVFKSSLADESGMTERQQAIVEDDEDASRHVRANLSDPDHENFAMLFKDINTKESIIVMNGDDVYPIYPGTATTGETFYFVEAQEGVPISCKDYVLYVRDQAGAPSPDNSNHLGLVKKVVNIDSFGGNGYYNVGTDKLELLSTDKHKIYVRIGEEGVFVAAEEESAKLPAAEDNSMNAADSMAEGAVVDSAAADAQVSFVYKLCYILMICTFFYLN